MCSMIMRSGRQGLPIILSLPLKMSAWDSQGEEFGAFMLTSLATAMKMREMGPMSPNMPGGWGL